MHEPIRCLDLFIKTHICILLDTYPSDTSNTSCSVKAVLPNSKNWADARLANATVICRNSLRFDWKLGPSFVRTWGTSLFLFGCLFLSRRDLWSRLLQRPWDRSSVIRQSQLQLRDVVQRTTTPRRLFNAIAQRKFVDTTWRTETASCSFGVTLA